MFSLWLSQLLQPEEKAIEDPDEQELEGAEGTKARRSRELHTEHMASSLN